MVERHDDWFEAVSFVGTGPSNLSAVVVKVMPHLHGFLWDEPNLGSEDTLKWRIAFTFVCSDIRTERQTWKKGKQGYPAAERTIKHTIQTNAAKQYKQNTKSNTNRARYSESKIMYTAHRTNIRLKQPTSGVCNYMILVY